MFHNSNISEFIRVLNIADIPPTGHGFHDKATTQECTALCTRFDLQFLKRFEISGMIHPQSKLRYVLEAKIVAEIVQTCVISLDPVENMIEENFELALEAAHEVPEETVDEVYLNNHIAEEPPLTYTDDKINYGECAVQYFSDCLDIYPRKPGAAFEEATTSLKTIREEKSDNPFKILQKLKGQ